MSLFSVSYTVMLDLAHSSSSFLWCKCNVHIQMYRWRERCSEQKFVSQRQLHLWSDKHKILLLVSTRLWRFRWYTEKTLWSKWPFQHETYGVESHMSVAIKVIAIPKHPVYPIYSSMSSRQVGVCLLAHKLGVIWEWFSWKQWRREWFLWEGWRRQRIYQPLYSMLSLSTSTSPFPTK